MAVRLVGPRSRHDDTRQVAWAGRPRREDGGANRGQRRVPRRFPRTGRAGLWGRTARRRRGVLRLARSRTDTRTRHDRAARPDRARRRNVARRSRLGRARWSRLGHRVVRQHGPRRVVGVARGVAIARDRHRPDVANPGGAGPSGGVERESRRGDGQVTGRHSARSADRSAPRRTDVDRRRPG